MDSYDLHTLGGRLSYLISLSGLGYEAIDGLASLTPGHTGQIARGGRTNPASRTLVALGRVLGASVEWLIDPGEEPARGAPSRRRVQRAVRLAGGAGHVATVAPATVARKRRTRSAGSARRGATDLLAAHEPPPEVP